jgi:hypothetical protein
MRLWLLIAILLPLPAFADTFGPWDFAVPDDYEREAHADGVLYNGPNGKFFFLAQTDMYGKDMADVATARLTTVLGATTQTQNLINDTLPDGVQMIADVGTLNGATVIVMTMAKDDAAATAMFITPAQDFATVAIELEALITTGFDPVVLTTHAPSALPAMDWPAPPAGIIASSRPKMSLPDARKRRIDPEVAPVRGTFACYAIETPRAVDPRPDLQIEVMSANRYRLTDGKTTSNGRYRVEPHETFDQITVFSGALANTRYALMDTNDGLGQSFDINNPTGEGELTCLQDGPMADSAQQAMAATAPIKGIMDCTKPDGTTFTLLYANGTYRAAGGQGRYTAWLEGNYGNWTGKMTFLGGPLDLQNGAIDADPAGGQELTIDQTWREGSMFYTASETTTFAACRMATPARPAPVYGLDPSPPATNRKGGLPEGYFKSLQSRYVYNGNFSNYVYMDVYTWVGAEGRFIEDPDLTEIGAMPDCTRSSPSGEEFCGEYRIIGRKISFRTERDYDDDAWSDSAPLTITATGFTIDDIDYTPVTPPTPDALTGAWSSSNFTGSGPAGLSGVGNYQDSDIRWTFTKGGRFDWVSSITSTTLITADPFLGGASGGGSNTSLDGGTGTYALDGYWLTLTFDDGRIRRFATFAGDVAQDGTRSLTIDGTDLGADEPLGSNAFPH